MSLPKKILRINDLTFILPDDFEGTIVDALNEFISYREENIKSAEFIDPEGKYNTVEILLTSGEDVKVCGEYGLFELIDGTYKIMQGSCPGKEE